MNPVYRQLLHGQRRTTAALRAADEPASRDDPLYRADVLARGVARIATNDEDGDYTITEQWWNPDTSEWDSATAPLGLVNASAREYSGNEHGSEEQLVRFWQQRAQGGLVETLIDVHGGWDGIQKVSSFCVHYSGVDETTTAFHSVPNCKYSCIEIAVSVRLCSGHGYSNDHPGYTYLCDFTKTNRLWSWNGSVSESWTKLDYLARGAAGEYLGESQSPVDAFFLECRVTAGGDLEFRVNNEREGEAVVSCVIVGAITVIPHLPPPGSAEIGNCCCHEDDTGEWGDGEWGPV